ncbi:MAG: alpha-mannosidase, partial [Clostridiales bacterium]|nr:alpha-mannosidase [Clostridiales bacterium]
MESLYALIKAAPNGYTNERAVNELRYVYELARLDPALMPLVESAADALYKRYLSDGAVTNTALAEMERSLAVLSPICKKLRVLLAGHAHIDMNWMWGYPETAAVTLDTFRTVLSLMREYPDFTFSQSQASVYKIVEEYEPAMLDEIRQRVRESRWELTASTWVETDKNMPDGESLARHILLTKCYLS